MGSILALGAYAGSGNTVRGVPQIPPVSRPPRGLSDQPCLVSDPVTHPQPGVWRRQTRCGP